MSLLKPISVYAFTIFFNAAISFVTFSILTHHLTEVDYGIINLYSAFIVFLSPFIAVGVQFVIGVDFFKMDPAAFKSRFTSAIAIPLASATLFTVFFVVFGVYIQQWLKINFLFTVLLPLICLITIFNDVFLSLSRNKGKHFLFAGYSVFKNVLEIGLTLLLIVGLGYRWEGRLTSLLLSSIAVIIVVAYVIHRWGLLSKRIDHQEARRTAYAGMPFIPERLAIFVLGFSDRFFINYYEGTADVGYYSAAAQLALIVNLTIITLCNAFYPAIFRSLSADDPAAKRTLKRITFQFIGFSAVAALGVTIAVPFFFKYFIGSHFAPGEKYAVYLIVGLFFWAVYNVFLAYLLNTRKNRLIMFISIAGMGLSLALNFFTVKYYGALGATYSSIVVYGFMAAAAIYFTNRFYGLKKLFARSV